MKAGLGLFGISVVTAMLAWALPSACAPPPPPKSDTGGGLSVVLTFALEKPDAVAASVASSAEIANPLVRGISWRFRWDTIEPDAGEYRWSKIDEALEASAVKGKKAMLRVTAGRYTPEWVYADGARKLVFENTCFAFPDNYPETIVMAPPWDEVYLAHWTRFVRELGKRYATNPNIYSIQMTGGGHQGEMNLPKCWGVWADAGYTDDKLIGAWKRIITAYEGAIDGGTPTNLDINEPLAKKSDVMGPVLAWLRATYPGKVFVQQNGLNASSQYDAGIRIVIRGASAWTTVGYQMLGGLGWLDEETGDRCVAFKNAREDHASYLEVYSSDIRAAETDAGMMDALRYLATGSGGCGN